MFLKQFCFFALLATVGTFTLNAQIQHQIGVNASGFVKQFITPNNAANNNANPYLVTYRMYTPKINYRAGVGGTYSFLNEDNGAAQFLQNTDQQSYNMRVGVDFIKPIAKRWFFYYGIDLTTFRSSTKIETTPKNPGPFVSKSIVTRTAKSSGASGCFTFEYRLNDKITMFTEANLNFTRSRSLEKVENPDFPNSSSESKTRAGNFNFTSPLSIFFSIIL